MNLGWRCDQRCAHLLLMVIAIYVQHIGAFHSPSLSFPPANRMIRFGKARTATNQLKVSNSLVDVVLDVEVYNQPSVQRAKITSADETIGIGLPNTSPDDRQVATSSRTKGIDWTYEMDVELFSLHWRYKQKHHVIEDVDWVEIAEELNEPGVYSNECLERYDFLHTDEYEKFVMYKDDGDDED